MLSSSSSGLALQSDMLHLLFNYPFDAPYITLNQSDERYETVQSVQNKVSECCSTSSAIFQGQQFVHALSIYGPKQAAQQIMFKQE
jgi:hypothetical protein